MSSIKDLEKQIYCHKDKYYNGEAEITDAEYDALEEQLRKLDPNNPALSYVGSQPSYGKKVKHSIPMGSLPKITYEKDKQGNIIGNGMKHLDGWYVTHDNFIVWSMKIDGAAGELKYKGANFKSSSTRGDGNEGSDITDNVKQIKSIPKKLKIHAKLHDADFTFRGEFYIPRSFFDTHLAGQGFANPRNAASGSIQAKDPKETGTRGLKFFVYKVFIDGKQIRDYLLEEAITSAMGLTFVKLNKSKLDEHLIAKLDRERRSYDYDTDGIVLAVNDRAKRESYGFTGNNPKGAVAFKFKAEQAHATILGVEWNVGRTGKITPIAQLSPTQLAGTTVQRSTLHNVAEIKRLGVVEGSTILLQKSGDIIPKIVRLVENPDMYKPIQIPTLCPTCGGNVRNDGTTIWCTNSNCTAKLASRIDYFLKTLNIKNIGTATIESLVNLGALKSISSLYELNSSMIMKMDGSGPRKTQIILDALKNNKSFQLEIFLHSLGITNLGKTTSKALAKHFKTLDSVMDLELDDLMPLNDIGTVCAHDIIKGLKSNKDEIVKLKNILDVQAYVQKVGTFTDQSFCFTGKLSQPRKNFEKLVEDRGGELKSVGKGLSYLVVGDAAGSKLDKAKKLNIKVLSEQDFNKML